MYEIDNVKFGAFIAGLRKENGWTQKQLAEKLFISDKAVSKWERGLSLPDISLLAPLAKSLGISLTELIQCQKSEIAGPLSFNAAEDVVTGTLSLAKPIAQKQKSLKRALIAVCLCFVLLASASAAFYAYEEATYPDPLLPVRATTGYTHTGDVSKWQDLFPRNSAYAIGFNKKGEPVFQNPSAALRHISVDCSDAIAMAQKQFHLYPFCRFTAQSYGTYGWQLVTDDSNLHNQGRMLSGFYDIYENSFGR